MGNLGSSSSNRMANFDYSSSARMMMYGRNNKSSPQLDYNWLVKPIPTMADASSLSNDDRCSTTNSMAWSTDDDDESLLANAPDWILTRVFSHLPVVDRLTVELVCWRWNRLVNDRDSWRRFWVMGNEELKLIKHKKFRTLLARFGYQVRQLEFVNLLSVDWRLTPRDVDRIHPMCDNLLTYILPSCSNVRHLRIDYRVFSACDFPIQPVVAKLRTLHIDQTSARDYYSVWYANTLVQLLDGVLCPLLQYLYLDLLPDIFVPMAIQSSCQFPASLRHLGFGPHVNKADIEPLAKMAADSCPNLHSFSARCCELKEATARRLMKNLHYLKESCYCTDDRHTVVRFGQWEKLRALSIQSLDQPILKTIAQNCPKLEHLAVEKCYGTVSTDFMVQHRMLESIKSVRLADYTAFQAFLPLLVRGTMEFIYLKFNLAGSELWQLVAANPRLRQLHLNQSMGTSVGEFLCREQARFWGNFPKVEADREPVHVYCRELDLDDEIVVSLRARLPWLLFETWTSLTFDETPMLLLDKIRYEGFAEIPL